MTIDTLASTLTTTWVTSIRCRFKSLPLAAASRAPKPSRRIRQATGFARAARSLRLGEPQSANIHSDSTLLRY